MGLAPWVEGESSKAMADLSKYDIWSHFLSWDPIV